jgi:hypothetical protein
LIRSVMLRHPPLLCKVALPCWLGLAQTLAQSTAKEDLLIHIEPKAAVVLQDRVGADHILPTALTRKPRHLESFPLSPAGL